MARSTRQVCHVPARDIKWACTTLQRCCRERATTQSQIAAHLGVSPQAVSFWLTGRYRPKGLNALRIVSMAEGYSGELRR